VESEEKVAEGESGFAGPRLTANWFVAIINPTKKKPVVVMTIHEDKDGNLFTTEESAKKYADILWIEHMRTFPLAIIWVGRRWYW